MACGDYGSRSNAGLTLFGPPLSLSGTAKGFPIRLNRKSDGARLPDAVYAELVEMLFTAWLPLIIMGGATICSGALIAIQTHDRTVGLLSAAIGAATVLRIAVTFWYRRRGAPLTEGAAARRWERRYAAGALVFAALLGVLAWRVMLLPAPLAHMLITTLVFGYGAGIVTRVATRPRLCVMLMMIAVVPTVAATLLRAGDSGLVLGPPVYLVQALVVTLFALGSLETMKFLHDRILGQLLTRHDLNSLVRQDPLTGLANRIWLRERFDASVARVASARNRLALHFIDLDGFKAINDGFGHQAGDAVLKEVSLRLARMVRAADTVARIGGDEFVIVQAEVDQESEADMLARRIVKTLGAPYAVDGKSLQIGASVGIALAPEHGLDLDTLGACADAALYRAKSGGRNHIVFCHAEDARPPVAAVA